MSEESQEFDQQLREELEEAKGIMGDERIYGWECRLLEVSGQIIYLEEKEKENYGND